MAIRWQPVLGSMICLIAAVYVAAQDQPPIASLTLDQALHFLKKDGGDVLLEPGTYRLEATQEHQLRLLSESVATPITIEAVELPHEKELTAPVAGTLASDEDSVHVVLFLPEGKALDAVGSRSGVRTRSGMLTTKQLAQVGGSSNEIKRSTESIATYLPVERNTGAKSSGFLPSCVQSSRGVECFIQSMTSPPSLLTAAFGGGKWSPWTSLGGSITSEPSCFNPGPGLPSGMENVACIALGLNSRLWLLKKANGQWTTNWQSIDFGDNIYAPDGVSCSSVPPGYSYYYCLVTRRTNNRDHDRIYDIRYADPNRPEKTGWGRWAMVPGGGVIDSKPVCFTTHVAENRPVPEYWNRVCYGWHSGQLVRLWDILHNPPSIPTSGRSYLPNPPSWTRYSGHTATPPSCSEKGGSGPDFVMCAALKADGSFVFRRAISPGTDLWQSVPGHSLAGPPTCLTGGICFAVGQDQKLWRFDLGTGSTPARAVRIPGSARLLPRLTCVRAGPIHCFAVALTTNDLMHYQIAP